MSLAEIIMNVETGHHRGEPLPRLIHFEEFGNGVAQGLGAVVRTTKRDLRHRVAQYAGSYGKALGVIGIEEAFR